MTGQNDRQDESLTGRYFEPWRRARVWSTKPGKISKNRNKQTSDQEHEINCTVPERKEIRAESFNIKFKVRSLNKGHIFFCFAYENLFSALVSRKGAELSTETKELISAEGLAQ